MRWPLGWSGPAGRLKVGQGAHYGPFGIMMVGCLLNYSSRAPRSAGTSTE